MTLIRGCRVAVVTAAALVVSLSLRAAEMKIMSFNVCHCSGMDGKIDILRTADRIRAENPDFACLQELDWCTARGNGDFRRRMTVHRRRLTAQHVNCAPLN